MEAKITQTNRKHIQKIKIQFPAPCGNNCLQIIIMVVPCQKMQTSQAFVLCDENAECYEPYWFNMGPDRPRKLILLFVGYIFHLLMYDLVLVIVLND